MAHLQRLSPSSHVLTLKDGTRVLFSYDTPVAAVIPQEIAAVTCEKMTGGGKSCLCPSDGWTADFWLKTSVFHSRTTSGHVSRFLAGNQARAVDQAVLNSLVEGV